MLLDEVGAYLASGLGLTIGTDLFLGLMPDEPAVCVSLHEYAGREPLRVHDQPGPQIERPRLQLLVRGEPRDYVGPRNQAEDAYRLLDEVTNLQIESVYYLAIRAIQSPAIIERDANERIICGFNAEAMRRA